MAIISGKSIFGSPKSRSRRGSDANRTPESKPGLSHSSSGRKGSITETISSQGSVHTTQHVLSSDSATSGNASMGVVVVVVENISTVCLLHLYHP